MESILMELRKFETVIRRQIEKSMPKMEKGKLFYAQVMVLQFLHKNDDIVIYQKDIMEHLQIRGSSVTKLLQRMEEKNLISRISDKTDMRKKQILMTEKSKTTLNLGFSEMGELSKKLESGISEEEKCVFIGVLDKLLKNTTDVLKTIQLPVAEDLC